MRLISDLPDTWLQKSIELHKEINKYTTGLEDFISPMLVITEGTKELSVKIYDHWVA